MYFDIALLVLAILFILGGLRKGFMRSVISLFGVLITLVVTILLAKSFGNFLSSFLPFDNWIEAPLLDKFNQMGGAMTAQVPADLEGMKAALTEAGIPGFLVGIIATPLFAMVPDIVAGTTFAAFLAPFVTSLIVTGIAGIVLFILLRIAVAILEHFAKKLANVQFVKVVDKSLGMVLGAAKCFVFVLAIFTVMSLMMNLNFMAPVKTQLEQSKVSKFLYENNFLAKFIFGKVAGESDAPKEAGQPAGDEGQTDQEGGSDSAEAFFLLKQDCIPCQGRIYRLTGV